MDYSLPSISGYTLTERLYAGESTTVYRAVATGEQYPRASEAESVFQACPVVIKLLNSPYPSFEQVVRFRNQYIIAKNLPTVGIVKPLTLVPWNHSYALVMEDVGGISLKDYVQINGPLSIEQGMAIALQLVDILHHLSRHQVVHKDIKPANILIHPETHHIWLIDFSLASLLPKETQSMQPPSCLEGTLAYIAPEQTGRMNRGIDYRADFYGLGVTLYELFTGQLPFQSKNPMDLIHCHIAKRPVPPCEVVRAGEQGSGGAEEQQTQIIPKMLSDIVLKLMAKNAEDRYQSALGLKHDLQRCLDQWTETGSIADFELGERDVSDRFLIPEKLYGRESEVQSLLDAFERVAEGNSEMMLVAGFSGIGKTAVVNEVHKPIVKQRGYFIKGKFDQFNRNIPFSAFVQAFRDLMGQLLGESDRELAHWKTKILEAVGKNGQVLIDVIPELENVIGPQPSIPDLSGSAAQNRFNLVFETFIAVFTTPDHPLVIFLDDLQWADSASLNLMNILMSDRQTGYLLLLGAYRDNEVFPTHPLILTLEELSKNRATLTTLTLDPLGEHHINQLVAETLHCQEEIAQPLSDLVYRKTQGNPFFTTQFLQGLYSDDYITFNGALGYWQCDLVNVQDAALTNDVVEFMMSRLQNLPTLTQEMLKLAACIGNQFDLETLGIIAQQSLEEVASNLWRALQEGLVLPISDTYKFFQEVSAEEQQTTRLSVGYRFLHDRVQQAAYTLIPEQQRRVTHLTIGQLLLTQTSPQQREEKIFAIVNQLNMGREFIVSPPKQEELAQLNLSAGNKAKSATAHDAAWAYYTIGIELLTPECWQTQYEFTLALYLGATEASYLSANFEEVERYSNIILEEAVSVLDKVKVYEIQIQVGMAKNELLRAVQIALKVLKFLGLELPENPTMADIQEVLQEVGMLCEGKSIDDLIDLPRMSEPSKIAALQILSIAMPPATISAPALFPLIVAQQVILCVKYGNAPLSAYAYVSYGFLLCAMPAGIEQGYQFGQLGLRMLEQSNSQELKAKILMLFNSFICCWKNHLKDTLQPLAEAYKSALESGDLEFAGYSIIHDVWHLACIGWYLPELVKKTSGHIDFLSQIKLGPVLVKAQLLQQLTLNLVGQSENPLLLKGAVYDEDIMLPLHQENKDGVTISLVYTYKLFLCYLFNIPNQGLEYIKKAEPYLDTIRAIYWIAVFYFYDSLTHLAIYRETPEGQLILERVATNQEKMNAWAHHAPMNFQHKYDLVEAEKYRVLERKMDAMESYDRAIAGAKENEYIQEEALANELFAKFYLDWGREKEAAVYMQEAYYGYTRWGARAKVADLETRYPGLLQSILQPSVPSFNMTDVLTTITQSSPLIHRSSSSASSSGLNATLDFAAVLKAAQALSSTIQRDEFLSQFVQTIVQNSGGDRCAILLPCSQGIWHVEAMTTLETITVVPEPLETVTHLPITLIRYVKNTQTAVVVDDLSTDLPVMDEYLEHHQPQSVLCLPMLHQDKMVGLLYVENGSTSSVFSEERIQVLNFLCTQAAISLANVQFYDDHIQASEARYQRLAENVPGVIYQLQTATEGHWQFNYMSPSCVDLFGLQPDRVLADSQVLRQLIHPADRDRFDISLATSADTLTLWQWEGRFVLSSNTASSDTASSDTASSDTASSDTASSDTASSNTDSSNTASSDTDSSENIKWLQGMSRPERQVDGTIIWDGMWLEISDRVRLEAARQQAEAKLRQSLEKLQASNHELEAFAYSIAHDLQSPLRTINAYSHVLLEDYGCQLDDVGNDYLNRIRTNTSRMSNLIDDLLHLSQVSRFNLKYTSVNLSELAQIILTDLQYTAPQRQVEFTIAPNMTVEADPALMNAVLSNLLGNAWKFSRDRTPTQIEVGHLPSAIPLDPSQHSKQIQDTSAPIYFVRDNGVGFDMIYADKLFGIFQRLHGMEDFPGTGLGLVIANRAIQRHGGHIWATAKVDQGATFYFTLPGL